MSEGPEHDDDRTKREAEKSLLAGWVGYTIVGLILLSAAIVSGGYLWLNQKYTEAGPLAADQDVVIPRGAGLERIANLLVEEGVLVDANIFIFGVKFEEGAGALRAGEYRFPAGVSAKGAADILRNARPVVRRVTIPEGLTTREIIDLVNATPGLEGLVTTGFAEGDLLPETYHFEKGDTRDALLARMKQAHDDALAEIWAKRRQGLPLNDPQELVILASIVEKETGQAQERPLVAGVFINRLNKPMRLQSDPTVVYGITLGDGPLGRSLTRKDLKEPTPYNTYTIDRLPPGPIANPGRASMEAVANPAETDAYYFVADGTGGHAFARTLAEHNRNVAKWRKIRDAQK
ncbi:MAG: endolytic transglycosylase MltG [Magnetovibrionaceae bacterium]